MKRLVTHGEYPWGGHRPAGLHAFACLRGQMPTHMYNPTSDQAAILRLIAEQRAVPLDQLARFFDLSLSDMRLVVQELQALRLVRIEEIQTGQPPWVWLSRYGNWLSGTGYRLVKPVVSWLAHIRAVNEIRLRITKRSPKGRWVCERQLRREWAPHGFRRHVPDAVFELSGKTHAIEVELSYKAESRLRPIIAEHSIRYDVVAYFCLPSIATRMRRLGLTNDYSNLLVRELAETPRRLPEEDLPLLPARLGKPKPDTVSVLDLIAEQGAIPLDQLARFLHRDPRGVERVVSALLEKGLIKRSHPLVKEPDWVWLSQRGARFSTTELSALRPTLGALPYRRVLNEVRLHMNDYAPKGKWVSARILRKQIGKKGLLPSAVIEDGSERYAIEICLSAGSKPARERRLTRRSAEYDAVLVFCAPAAYGRMKRMEATDRWPKLVVRRIPSGFSRETAGQGEIVTPLLSAVGADKVATETVREETAGQDEIVTFLREAVSEGRLQPSRARSIAGYLLLSAAGVDQGPRRTICALRAESRRLGLLRRPHKDPAKRDRVESGSSRPAYTKAIVNALREAVSEGRLQPSRARSLAGYLLLSAAGVPQGAERTFYVLKQECRQLGLPLSPKARYRRSF